MTEEDEFWNQPLAIWLKDLATGDTALVTESQWRLNTVKSSPIRYRELTDGVLLALIFHEIEPIGEAAIVISDPGASRDINSKQRLFFCLLEAIRRFYRHHLNQLVVIAPPDIPLIVRGLRPEESSDELNKFLLLLLGCAVQGERRKTFVERITRLAPQTQNALARHIQRVTEGSTVVLSVPYQSDEDGQLVTHLERAIRERDALALQVHHMSTDPESDEGSSTTATSSINGDPPVIRLHELKYDRTASPTNFDKLLTNSRSNGVDLAQRQQEIRAMQHRCQELENELQDREFDLQQKEEIISKMQEERHILIKDATAARDLRDELDCLQLKVNKLEKLEQQNKRYQEQLVDKEYWDSRAKDLLTENDNLRKTMNLMEEQILAYQQKSKEFPDGDNRIEDFQAAIRKLQVEINEKNGRIEALLVEQSRLENNLFLRNEKLSELERTAIASDGLTPRENYGSLADQLEDSHRAETARLRLEVQQLRAKLENKEDSSEISFSILVPELEDLKKEVQEKDKQLAQMKDENDIVTKQLNHLEQTLSALNADFKETTEELNVIRVARDEAIHNLHDARRKFTQFQAEFGIRFELEAEKKVRECEIELEQAKVRLQSTEEERSLFEKQLEKLREEQRQLRNELDDVKESKNQVELQLSRVERSLKSAENEKNVLRERADKAEDELEALRMRMLTSDDAAKRLELSEKLLVEQSNHLNDIEAENRTLQQQVDLESKKTQRLREDLVTEKTRSAELIGRLRSLCAAINLNGGKIDAEIEDSKLIDTIDDVMMTALHAAKREADAARLQQHTQLAELADLRKDIEKLRRSESASLIESDDKVRELGKENINMKEQIFVLQEKIRELQIEVSTKTSEIVVAKREIEELNRNTTTATVSNTELARLQVSLRNLQLQEELLKQDNQELRNQLDLADKSRLSVKKDADSLTAMHQALLTDHDRLQKLHDLLTQDYEQAKQDNQEMKLKLRNHRPSPVVVPTRELEELRTTLAQERLAREKQMRTFADLQNEHGSLKREMDTVRKENDYLSKNCDGISAELRSLKLTEQAQKATIRDLTATVEELTKDLRTKELEIAKLQHRVEMLSQLNRTLDEENKNLSRQIEMLMGQNKELWSRALTDKDQHLQEQKDFQERLSALRRHKEKLEEKIMEQYRTMENKRCPPDRSKQNTLVKRAAKALISRRRPSQPSSNGASSTEDSSNYSADECPAINGHEEFDLFPPTCSSSEDQDRVSPRYETIINFKNPDEPTEFRRRNDVVGGSVRVYPANRRPFQPDNKIFEERGVDVPSYLPPRVPVRNSSATASLRITRPPPPPYKVAPKNQPIYAQPNAHNAVTSPSPVPMFIPNACSTPKSDHSSVREDHPVVAEGERRTYIREKEERVDKAMSIYENVPAEHNRANESTVWYEYGCV